MTSAVKSHGDPGTGPSIVLAATGEGSPAVTAHHAASSRGGKTRSVRRRETRCGGCELPKLGFAGSARLCFGSQPFDTVPFPGGAICVLVAQIPLTYVDAKRVVRAVWCPLVPRETR